MEYPYFQEEPSVELRDVRKAYRLGRTLVEALRGVTLCIAPNSFVSIVGPSGSGKSTLLNILGCLDLPTSGSARICGVTPAKLSDNDRTDFRAREIGFVFQSFSLIPMLSALQNVEQGLLSNKLTKRARRERAMAMLEDVGLADQARRRPNEMSGGQQQRVAIARALAKEPKLVLADEPTANLDSKSGDRVLDVMLAMRERVRTSFVFSTHDPRLVERMQEVVVLQDGVIVEPVRAVA